MTTFSQETYSIRDIEIPGWGNAAISDIEQDQLGLIWISTDQGLFRFDGSDLVSYQHHPFDEKTLRTNRIRCLFLNHNSRLLLGTDHGLHRYLKSSNTFQHYDFGENLDIQFITEDLHNYLWMWTDKGLFWMYHEPGTDYYWGQSALDLEIDIDHHYVHDAFITPREEMWVASTAGLMVFDITKRCEPQLVHLDTSFSSEGGRGIVKTMIRDFSGRIWLGTTEGTYMMDESDHRVSAAILGDEEQSMNARSFFLSSTGKLFLADADGVFVLCKKEGSERLEALTLNYGFEWLCEDIRILREDRLNKENLFIVDSKIGLRYLEKAEVKTQPASLSINSVQEPLVKSGNLIIPEANGATIIHHGNLTMPSPIRIGLGDSLPLEDIVDVGLNEDYVVVAFKNGWQVHDINDPDRKIRFLHSQSNISTVAIVKDSIYLGLEKDGLKVVSMDGRELKRYLHRINERTGLPSNQIHDLHVDSHGRLWIGTDEGVSRLSHQDGRFKTYRKASGLPNEKVLSLNFDTSGTLWVLTSEGFSLYDESEDRFYVIRGIYSEEMQATQLLMLNKSMYVMTEDGPVNVVSEKIEFRNELVPVRLSWLYDASGKKYYLIHRSPDMVIDVPYDHNSLLIEFITIQPIHNNKYTFKYQLEGPRKEAGELYEAKSLNLNSLKSGAYELTINAFNDKGKICGQDAIKFAVAPPFWMTKSFYGLILLGILLLFGAYWVIIKDQERKRKMAVQNVQKQTAADFHDELGSRLTVISLYSNMIRRSKGPKSAESEAYLDKVLDSANELYYAMKDVIWSMKPEAESVIGLADHLVELGTRMLASSTIEFTSSVQGVKEDLPLNKEISKHLTLISREAMHNALRHSGATSFDLTINLKDKLLSLELTDNGKGLNIKNRNGNGLENMKRRAEEIGANLEIIDNQPGVRISIIILLEK